MAEMIAMLSGMGAYGENPIGDVDPSTITRYGPATQQGGLDSQRIVTYAPQPYALQGMGAEPEVEKTDWVTVGIALLAIGGIAWLLLGREESEAEPEPEPEGVNGAPEMIDITPPKRKARRKKGHR